MWSERLLALHRNIVQSKLSKYVVKQYCVRKLLVQCWLITHSRLSAGELRNILRVFSGFGLANIAQKITRAMLAHSPQINVYMKITYKCVWIYLGQHRVVCQRGRRGLLIQCWCISYMCFNFFQGQKIMKVSCLKKRKRKQY